MVYVEAVALLGGAIAALCREDDKTALVQLERAVKILRGQQTLPGVPGAVVEAKVDDERKLAVVRLFMYWQQQCNHQAAKLTSERSRAVAARLRDGYSEAEIRKAVDGAARAAYVSDEGHRYDDLELICRNGTKLEAFIARGVTATGEIPASAAASTGSLEEQISVLRRSMAEMKSQGRDAEYALATKNLAELMSRRSK